MNLERARNLTYELDRHDNGCTFCMQSFFALPDATIAAEAQGGISRNLQLQLGRLITGRFRQTSERQGQTMSPRILSDGALVFWFHSYDARYENRASIHVGKGSQDDHNDAKIWLEPEITVARQGRTLRRHELRRALKVAEEERGYLKEQWYEYKGRSS